MSALTRSTEPFSPAKSDRLKKVSSFTTPKHVKVTLSQSPVAGGYSKQNTASSFFKTSPLKSTTNQRAPNSKDIAILHESRIFKHLLASAEKKKEAKRDPILQNNDDYVQEFRPSVRRLASADRMSACRDEVVSRSKAVGEFNYIYNPPPLDPRPQGIRAFVAKPSESSDENPRRKLKAVRHKSEARRNPITEGDVESLIVKRLRKCPDVDPDHQKRLNDRKFLLPADRGCSNKGQMRFQKTFTLGGDDPTAEGCLSERLQTSPSRPRTAMEEKMRGSIKGVLEYEGGPAFRDERVTGKCNTIKFTDLLNSQDADRVFGRKTTLQY